MDFTIATWVWSACLLSTPTRRNSPDFATLTPPTLVIGGSWRPRRDSADTGGGHHRPSGKHPCQVLPVVRLRVHFAGRAGAVRRSTGGGGNLIDGGPRAAQCLLDARQPHRSRAHVGSAPPSPGRCCRSPA